MTFREIARKNLRYNIRKFTSYFLVNAFVVCALFLYGSLLHNRTLEADPMLQGMRPITVAGVVAVTAFAIIFLIYTGFYFVRSRGKEFGVYLTLGMTRRDLVRMAVTESMLIYAGATALGIGAGLLFGNLFFLILGWFLAGESLFALNWQTFAFTFATLVGTFVVQLGMINVFVRRLSIVNIAKSAKTKGRGRQNPVVGIVSVVTLALTGGFVLDLLFTMGWTQHLPWRSAVIDLYYRFDPFSMLVVALLLFVSLFFTIGSGITVLAALSKLFPRLHQRNILLFSGLTHRFRSYRTILFTMSILTGFAIFMIGILVLAYRGTTDETMQASPFHFTIEQRVGMNQLSETELRQIVADAGGEIETLYVLPYLDVRHIHTGMDVGGTPMLAERYRPNYLVSDAYFNRFTLPHEPFVVAPYELLFAHNSIHGLRLDSDDMLVVEPLSEAIVTGFSGTEWPLNAIAWWDSVEGIPFGIENPSVLYFSRENIRETYVSFTNSPLGTTGNFHFVKASVINHELWENLAENGEVNQLLAFNLVSGSQGQVMDALVAALVADNNLPPDLWDAMHAERYTRLRPLSQAEQLRHMLHVNGFMLFVIAFIGILFLVSTFIVLFYKFVADMDEEGEQVAIYKKVGLTARECRRYIQAHLGIVFFFPLVLGGGVALGVMLQMLFNLAWVNVWEYFRYLLLVFAIVLVFNMGLYAALRKRFFIRVGVWKR